MTGLVRAVRLDAGKGLPRSRGACLLACAFAALLATALPGEAAFADSPSALSDIAIEVEVYPAPATESAPQDQQSLPSVPTEAAAEPSPPGDRGPLAQTGDSTRWVLLLITAGGGIVAYSARRCGRRRGSAHVRR